MAALNNIGMLFQYSLIYDIVLFAFAGIALNISLTVIEWHFSVLAATVLLPWAPLGRDGVSGRVCARLGARHDDPRVYPNGPDWPVDSPL